MKILILGSGIIGVTTAYYLSARGHEVTVIDRQPGSAEECSYANGGQLSFSHVEPWASPDLFPRVFKWLVKKHSPLVFRPKLDPAMWSWLAKFLSNCNEAKVKETTTNLLRLSLYSKECIHKITNETGLSYAHLTKGTLHIFRNEKNLKAKIEQAAFQKELGCDFELLESREACLKKAPSLTNSPKKIIGGIYFPMDESGDVHEFTVNLAKIAEQKNKAKFIYNTNILKIIKNGGKIDRIETDKGDFTADSYVMSLGAYSPIFLKQVGINVPIYPLKGYSISIPLKNPDAAPKICITDQANKVVYSRLGNTLRVAGTAEFAGYDHTIRNERINTLKRMTRGLFPDSGDIINAEPWACLRPSTPDSLPILGKSPLSNLFLNTGQGTLGWTLSCGSAKIIGDIIEQKEPDIDLTGLTMERFS